MATIAPGTQVNLAATERAKLAFPPPAAATLVVAVHRGALGAPRNGLTQLVGILNGSIVWAGALDEAMLRAVSPGHDERRALGERTVVGAQLWDVIRPGLLTEHGVARPLLTAYDGDRPWMVIGELVTGDVLAAPLNDATGNTKWFTPVIGAGELLFPGSKESQLEWAHLWSFGRPVAAVGTVSPSARIALGQAIKRYFT